MSAAASVAPPEERRDRCGWSRSSRPVIQSRSAVADGSQEPTLKITGTRPYGAAGSSRSRVSRIVRTDLPDPALPSTTSRPEGILR
ncbi:hypothetical protein LUR56_22680 [Streptomyces sp. MT29]|nr:hypothetical protein [Streptomyces sp. MT29]